MSYTEYASKDYVDEHSGVSSWNDLKDRPFYEEFSVDVVIPETTVTTTGSKEEYVYFADVEPEKLIEGKVYTITFDDVEYQLSPNNDDDAMKFSFGDADLLFGNIGAWNDIPFLIYHVKDGDVYFSNIYTQVAGEHTVKIELRESEVKLIDEKYIPDTIVRTEQLANYIQQVSLSIDEEGNAWIVASNETDVSAE